MAYKGKRSYLQGPWHDCMRCGDKTHISEMTWQRGLLLDAKCVDTGNDGFPLIGQREQAIVTTFETPSQELMPDPRLTDVSEIEGSMEEDLIY